LLGRYAIVAVVDQMLQEIDSREGTGYLAYADPTDPDAAPGTDDGAGGGERPGEPRRNITGPADSVVRQGLRYEEEGGSGSIEREREKEGTRGRRGCWLSMAPQRHDSNIATANNHRRVCSFSLLASYSSLDSLLLAACLF